MNELVLAPQNKVVAILGHEVPAVLQYAGQEVLKAFGTFFTDQIRNKNTRDAYLRNTTSFFEWCELKGLAFADIESFHISAYVEHLLLQKSPSTVKQHLASIKMLFDWLVTNQQVPRNPAAAVRGPKLVQRRGKTPVLFKEGAKDFFDSFEIRASEKGRELNITELRDRAFCAVMTYAMARVDSVCRMTVGDYYPNGKTWWLRFHGKGGVFHEMPANHKLIEYLDAYIEAAGIGEERKEPLFRSARRTKDGLTDRAICRNGAWQMVKRRAKHAGIQMNISNHSFRGTGITNYLQNGGQLTKAQDMAAHADPRTTRLYDHSGDEVNLDEVERIQF